MEATKQATVKKTGVVAAFSDSSGRNLIPCERTEEKVHLVVVAVNSYGVGSISRSFRDLFCSENDQRSAVIRVDGKSQVRQCLCFCSADSQANEDQTSAVQKPKHCRTGCNK